MKSLALLIPFPAAGLSKQFSYVDQPPATTPFAVNVRPESVGASVSDTTANRRVRGGSRPGIGKAYQQIFGSATGSAPGMPIRMLATLTLAQQNSVNSLTDNFNNTRLVGTTVSLLSPWKQASWLTFPPRPYPDDQTLLVFDTVCGVVHDAVTYDATQPYTFRITINPYAGSHSGTYSIWARMNDTAPAVLTDGVSAELILTGTVGAYSGNLKVYIGGVLTTYPFNSGSPASPHDIAESGDFLVTINGNNIKATWKDHILIETGIAAQTGTRWGFGMNATVAAGICFVDSHTFTYIKGDRRAYVNPLRVLTSANGWLYCEGSVPAAMDQVPSTTTLNTDRQLQTAQLGGNLYIADYGAVKAQGRDGTLSDDGLQLMSTADVPDFVASGVDATTDVVVISEVQGDAVAGTYRIAQVTSDRIVLTRKASTGTGGTGFFRIERAPKKYLGADNTLQIWEADPVDAEADPIVYKGEVPTGCPLICSYRGRMVLAGGAAAPNVWYMSRQDDPDDWDYGKNDTRAAVAGNNSDAGIPGDPIKALVPHSDDYLVMGCPASLWVLRGDPLFGGEIVNISRTIGIGWQKSWCYGPSGELIFMSYDGVYVLAPGANSFPVPLTRGKLPDDFDIPDINRNDYEVLMEYDTACAGIHIYITQTAGDNPAPGRHFWLAWNNQSFWGVELPTAMEPTAITAVNTRYGTDSPVFIGGRDGYIRAYRDAFLNDDGEFLSSSVKMGPFFYAKGGDMQCLLGELSAILSTSSGSINWHLFTGNSPEEAYRSTVAVQGIFDKPGQNRVFRPRVRGNAFYLYLFNVDNTKPWALEKLTGQMDALTGVRLS